MTASLLKPKRIKAKKTQKILAIQFKYLGDAVFITPALQVLHQQHPEAEIHVLAAEEVAPIFQHLSFLTKVWSLPRTRGKAKLGESLPFVFKLRKEKFDLSIDFVGNDRGSIFSLLIGAKSRLAAIDHGTTFLQKLAYTRTVRNSLLPTSWVKRHLKMLSLFMPIIEANEPRMKIESDPQLQSDAIEILQEHEVICHLGTSQPKKEWHIHRWVELHRLASKAGYKLAFSAGTNQREQTLISELKELCPDAFVLPRLKNLSDYLAVLNQAKVVISGDTGPLHFGAGLGVKVIGLFGTADSVRHASPIYQANELVMSRQCTCINELARFPTCQSRSPCMDSISAEQVFELLKERYPLNAP